MRENHSPGFSILAVRELSKTSNGNYFTQLSASMEDDGENSSLHGNQDERIILNAGFGKRILTNDNILILGINNFYDYDVWMSHSRIGLGVEAKSAVVDFNANYYQKINSGGNAEFVMNGYDYQLKTQVPYVHWVNIFANSYKWYGKDRDDVEGMKLGGEAQITSTLSFLHAYDDKDTSGVTDEWYSKIVFNFIILFIFSEKFYKEKSVFAFIERVSGYTTLALICNKIIISITKMCLHSTIH